MVTALRAEVVDPAAAHGAPRSADWVGAYIRRTVVTDGTCALAAGLLAFELRFGFGDLSLQASAYLLLSCALPVLWCAAVAVAGGYDSRFIGLGSDEFRRVLSGAVGLTAGLAIYLLRHQARHRPRVRGDRIADSGGSRPVREISAA